MTERENFEAWFHSRYDGISMPPQDRIMLHTHQWASWQAATASTQEQVAAKDEFIKTCFRSAADGGSLDGADIQELGERLGLFGRETYQPVLHGYICGHEAGEDTVYVMKENPVTSKFIAEQQAIGVEKYSKHCQKRRDELLKEGENTSQINQAITSLRRAAEYAEWYAQQLRDEVKP